MKKGRPLKYKTVIELQTAIDEYFENRNASRIPPTVSGLALYLGFEDRQSIYNYKERPEFSNTIKKALLRMVDYAETTLLKCEGPSTGAIFWLKNHGWKDKTEIDNRLQADDSLKEFINHITARK